MKSRRRLSHSFIFLFVFTILNTLSAFAGPSRTTYQAKIVKPDGYPLEASSVNFKFTILDPAGSCILYSETYSAVNMSGMSGLISFSLGSGVKTYPTSTTTTFEEVFSNITPNLPCDVGGPPDYTPSANDIRKIVMQFHDGSGWQTLPAMSINAVPYAMYANDSTKLNGKTDADFVQISTVPTCGASEALRYTGTGFTCIAVVNAVTSGTVATALGFTPADSASLTTVTANISSVSSTVFSVSSTVSSLQNTVAASFAAMTSSQWTTSGSAIYFNNNVGIGTQSPATKLDVAGGLRISMEAATCATNLAGTLRYNSGAVEFCNGTTWTAFGVSGAGLQGLNGSTSGTQSFAIGTAGTAPNFATANGVHTLSIPLANAGSVTGGLISNADYTTFMNKITSSAASIAQVLGYTPASSTALANYVLKANNLNDLTSSATARTNLGVGYIGTLSSVDLSSSDVSGTLAIARTPSYIGDVTKSAASNTLVLSNTGVTAGTYTKVTVDAKGRVTSSSSLSSGDVTTALGYTPANSATIVSSQWTTSGSAIYYGGSTMNYTGTASSAVLVGSSQIVFDGGAASISRLQWNSGTLSFGKCQDSTCGPMSPYLDINTTSNITTFYNMNAVRAGNGNGTAATPTFSFGQSTNTGMFNPGTSILAFSTNAAERIRITSAGAVGIGTTDPKAILHLKAGTTATNTAPLKFTSGTLLTSPESGTVEYDGTNLYFTDSTNTRRTIASTAGAGTYDSASLISNSGNITMYPNSGAGSVIVSATTASTSSNTGALVVKGGLGVAGTTNISGGLNVSGSSVIDGSLKLSSMTNGSVLFAGTNGTVAQNNSQFYWDNTNNRLGLGTVTPTSKFTVKGTRQGTITPTNSIMQVGGDDVFLFVGAGDGVGNPYPIMLQSMRDSDSVVFPLVLNPNGGNVGIGTSAPSANLEVSSSGAASTVRISSTAASNVLGAQTLGFGTMVSGVYTPTAIIGDTSGSDEAFKIFALRGNLSLGSNTSGTATTRMVVNQAGGVAIGSYVNDTPPVDGLILNGNVGIGTPAPTGTLDVVSSLGAFKLTRSVANATAPDIYLQKDRTASSSVVSGDAGGHISFSGFTGTSYTRIARISSFVTSAPTDGYITGDLRFYTNNNLTDATERMRISASGNVGIGTTAPSTALTVLAPVAGGGIDITAIDGVADDNFGISWKIPAQGHELARINAEYPTSGSSGTGNLKFKVRDAGTLADRMTILGNGNVGIGATSPQQKLDVVGTIRAGNYTATQGSVMLVDAYSSGSLTNFGTEYSSGGPMLGYGVIPSNTTPASFLSSTPISNLSRSAINMSDSIRFYLGATQTVSTGSAVSLSEAMRITTTGIGIGTSAPAAKFEVLRNFNGESNTTAGFIGGYDAGYTNTGAYFVQKDNTGLGAANTNLFNVVKNGISQFSVNGAGDTFIGTDVAGTGYGKALWFKGVEASSDSMWMAKYVNSADVSQLRVNIGDENSDYFTVGYSSTGTQAGTWTNSFWVKTDGSAWLAGTLTQASDARLKKNIRPLDNSLEKILRLEGVTYNWVDPRKPSSTQVGLIAQEVEKVYPEIVANNEDGYKSVAYQNLVAPMINAIKELYVKVVTLFDRTEKQSRQIASLEAENAKLKESDKAKDQKIKNLEERMQRIEKALNQK